jgi:hypothetical protein
MYVDMLLAIAIITQTTPKIIVNYEVYKHHDSQVLRTNFWPSSKDNAFRVEDRKLKIY